MPAQHVPVVVIGAGPYGLSVAAHLRAQNTLHRVFGHPMSTWEQHMPGGMFLRSEGCASNLSDPGGGHTLGEYCRRLGLPYTDVGDPVPVETFLAYGRWFQQRLVPEVEPLDVLQVERDGAAGGFRVLLSDGTEVGAERVVVATGLAAYAHVPAALAGLPARYASHTSAHRDLAAFAGQEVAVLGCGQSALECAALLREAGARPQVLSRAGRVHWIAAPMGRSLYDRVRSPQTALGLGWKLAVYLQAPSAFRYLPAAQRVRLVRNTLGPSGAWWLRQRVQGAVPVHFGLRLRGGEVVGGRVRLAFERGREARVFEADHVLAGTGYRVDLARLPFLGEPLRAGLRTYGGFPRLTRQFESSVPGLYFVGLAAALDFGPLQRFVHGARFAALRVSAAVARRPAPQQAPAPGLPAAARWKGAA